jgi:hypothetical protein
VPEVTDSAVLSNKCKLQGPRNTLISIENLGQELIGRHLRSGSGAW